MSRKHTVLILVVALMTTFLAPARRVLACQDQPQTTVCPMRVAAQTAEEQSCCVKKAPVPDASISAPCCCNIQSAPPTQSAPAALSATPSLVFVLRTLPTPSAPPAQQAASLPRAPWALTAPRGPPLFFAALRAPPFLS